MGTEAAGKSTFPGFANFTPLMYTLYCACNIAPVHTRGLRHRFRKNHFNTHTYRPGNMAQGRPPLHRLRKCCHPTCTALVATPLPVSWTSRLRG